MIERFTTWIDKNPTPLGPTDRTRVRIQHVAVLLLLLVGTSYLLLYAWLCMFASAASLAISIAGSLAGLFLLTRRGRAHAGGLVVSLSIFVVLCATLVGRGGMASNSAGWLLLAPLTVVLMIGPRHGMLMGAITALFYGLLWVAEHMGVAMPAGLPAEIGAFMPVVDHVCVASMFCVVLWVQSDLWTHGSRQLDGANRLLQDEIEVRQAAESEAQNAARSRYTFLATMSHEIRTPLNGVLGLTEILLDTEMSEEQRSLASTVRSSGELLRAVLDDVLDFSKIDSGRLDLESTPFDVQRICHDLEQLWEATAAERDVSLKAIIEPRAPHWVLGDQNKLRQILGNLVSNAVKFTEQGHVHIVLAQGAELVIRVEDTGIGLDPATLQHIFEPFRQADRTTTRRFGGTGLGLAICRRLATAMHGELTVTSSLGEGASFNLRLPLVQAQEPTEGLSRATSLDGHGVRVLVAEDNAVNQMVMRRLLQRMGIEVLIADNGESCVQAWAEHKPHLILMDCQMPVCDGYDASHRIRAAGGTLPIIAVTANTMPGDRARSLAAGMDEHLGKPVKPEQLEAALRKWLPKAVGAVC